jgi:hypothetical protein
MIIMRSNVTPPFQTWLTLGMMLYIYTSEKFAQHQMNNYSSNK